MHRQDSTGGALVSLGQRVFVCFEHNCHIGTFWTSPDRSAWTKYGVQIGVSGYHHNIAYDFLSLRPGLNASGEGRVLFRDFRYETLWGGTQSLPLPRSGLSAV